MDLVMAFAVPVFLLAILVEHAIAKRHGTDLHELRDTRTSLILGAVSVVAGLPFRFGFVWVLTQLYQHRFFDFEMGVASYIAFFLLSTKEMLNREASMDLLSALEAEAQAQTLCMMHPDFKEAYDALSTEVADRRARLPADTFGNLPVVLRSVWNRS